MGEIIDAIKKAIVEDFNRPLPGARPGGHTRFYFKIDGINNNKQNLIPPRRRPRARIQPGGIRITPRMPRIS